MNERVDMEALAAAFEETAEAPQEAEEALDAAAEEPDEWDEAEPVEAQDEAEEDDEKEVKEPAKSDTLTLLNADGEPEQVKLDKLLADTLHDVEIDGEVQQVSYDDLRRGFMMQQDYSRKTQEVAKQVDELAPYADMVAFAKSDPRFVQYMQAYFVHGADPAAGLSRHGNVTDDQLANLLASDDPEELNLGREVARERAQLRKTMAEKEQKLARQAEERAAMFRQWAANEDQRARSTIPDYDNALKGAEEYLAGYGFTPQEIQSLVDHRLKRVLADALGGRRLRDKSTSPKSELRAKRKQPAPPRSIKSSGRGKPEGSVQTRLRNAEKRARQSGATDDWAAVIGARLGLE